MNKFKRFGLMCLPLFLAACESIPSNTPSQESNKEVQQVTEPKPKQEIKQQTKEKPAQVDDSVKASPAVISLLDRAEQQQKDGNNAAAVGSLERAIRIAPRYPETYYRLGELRYQEGNYSQARSLGQKTLSLGATGWLLDQAKRLIENASQ